VGITNSNSILRHVLSKNNNRLFNKFRFSSQFFSVDKSKLEIDESNSLINFANACRNNFMETNTSLTEVDLKKIKKNDCQITKVNYFVKNNQDQEEPCITSYLLPSNVNVWPTFLQSTKQIHACAKDVYVQRLNKCDVGRMNETIKLLKKREIIIWIGLPGIAKSTDLNIILIKLLKELSSNDGEIKIVAYRATDTIYEFTLNSEGNVQVRTIPAETLLLVIQYGKDVLSSRRDRNVLLLELEEAESDPSIKGNFGCLITSSSRNCQELFKTIYKGGCFFMLLQPWKLNELKCFARSAIELSEDNPFNDEFNKTLDDITAKYNEIGGVIRHIVSNLFFKRFIVQRNMVLKDNFVIYDLTVYNVPSNAKYFIAAFIKDDVEIPFVSEEIVDTYYFEFLSNPAKLLIGEKVSSPDEVLSLQGYAFNYLIAEDIVLYNILTNKRNEKYPSWPKQWSQNNWEWHTDVGYTNFLSPNSIIQNKKIMTMPICEKLYLFQSTTLQIPVYDLHEDIVYKSTFHNMKIGEFLTVNHTQKIVTFYQVTNRNLKDHPFKLKTIYDAMNDLSMFAEAGLKYTLRLLCFVDSTVSNPRGIAFENNVVLLSRITMISKLV
jgi:hypothetical protein